MQNKTIKESIVTIQKEKLSIVLKEILHLKYILNYYSPKKSWKKEYSNNNETRKIDMSTANNSLRAVEASLEKIQIHIQMLHKYTNKNQNNIYFLILHSKIRREFNNVLYIIELIYKKVYQIFEESYHQYIPKPTLGRRFSNNNLVGRLKKHYESIIRSLVGEEYKSGLILSWSYRNYISLEEKHNRFTDNNGDIYGAYINLPYWYYEIPTLLPSVAHECMRISLLKGSKPLRELRAKFDVAVNSHLNMPRDDLSFTIEEKILREDYNLTNKVVADLAAYSLYGNAYLYSIFHDTIGVELSKLFHLKNKEEQKEYDSLKKYIESNFIFKISSLNFDASRDTSIIRLNILLAYADNPYNENLVQMKALLNAILPTYEKEGQISELEAIFKNHEHYSGSFKIYKKALLNIFELYKEVANKARDDGFNIKIKNNSINFNKLWQAHLTDSIHKNELRKELHKKTFEEIYHSNPTIALSDKELGKPYSLTFIKILKDIDCKNSEDNQTICLDKEIAECFKDIDYYHAFGIYDLAILKDTSNYHKDINNIIEEKFNRIKNLSNGLSIRYYESKFSLMQIYPTIKGPTSTKHNNSITILYNITLNPPRDNHYTYLAKSIKKIAESLTKNEHNFIEAKIFKTLGPGDLIVLIEGVPKDDFLYYTEKIIPLSCVKRTFTTILASKGKKEHIKPKQYRTVSFIRLDLHKAQSLEKTVDSMYDEMKQSNISQYVDSIHFTSGVLDLEIIWKPGISVKQIMNFYDTLMRKKLVRDFQTKFNKIYQVDSNVMNIPHNPEPAR